MDEFREDVKTLFQKNVRNITEEEINTFLKKHKQYMINLKCDPYDNGENKDDPTNLSHGKIGKLVCIQRCFRESFYYKKSIPAINTPIVDIKTPIEEETSMTIVSDSIQKMYDDLLKCDEDDDVDFDQVEIFTNTCVDQVRLLGERLDAIKSESVLLGKLKSIYLSEDILDCERRLFSYNLLIAEWGDKVPVKRDGEPEKERIERATGRLGPKKTIEKKK